MNRRSMMKLLGLGAVAIVTAGKSVVAFAANWKAKKVKVDSKAAQRLNLAISRKDYSGKKEIHAQANCYNCNFYKIQKEEKNGDEQWAPCAMLANKYVERKWACRSWAKHPKRFKA